MHVCACRPSKCRSFAFIRRPAANGSQSRDSYTNYIKGVSRVMSQNILGILFDMIKSPEATARYTWTRGALAIWDNRVVQHKGIKDYGSGRRILYRATMTA